MATSVLVIIITMKRQKSMLTSQRQQLYMGLSVRSIRCKCRSYASACIHVTRSFAFFSNFTTTLRANLKAQTVLKKNHQHMLTYFNSCLSIQIPFIFSLSLTCDAKISTDKINNSALTGQPCKIPLVGCISIVSHPLFLNTVQGLLYIISIHFIKLSQY